MLVSYIHNLSRQGLFCYQPSGSRPGQESMPCLLFSVEGENTKGLHVFDRSHGKCGIIEIMIVEALIRLCLACIVTDPCFSSLKLPPH